MKAVARAIVPGSVRRYFQKRKLDRRVAAFRPRVVEHCYGGLKLRVQLADPLAAGWYDHDWSPSPEWELLGRLRPGARVYDIGAHQGVVGLMLGHRVGPTGSVVLVEPNSHNIAVCRRNAELNGMPWVVPMEAAISDRAGTLSFNGGLNGAAAEVSDYAGVGEVAAVTLDGLVDRHGPPDVVFVDVEGFECRALAAATRAFDAHPDWFVEVHVGCGLETAGGSVEEILARFPAAAYDRFIHSEGDREAVRLDIAPSEKLRTRFFLTAVARRPMEVSP